MQEDQHEKLTKQTQRHVSIRRFLVFQRERARFVLVTIETNRHFDRSTRMQPLFR